MSHGRFLFLESFKNLSRNFRTEISHGERHIRAIGRDAHFQSTTARVAMNIGECFLQNSEQCDLASPWLAVQVFRKLKPASSPLRRPKPSTYHFAPERKPAASGNGGCSN